MNRDRRNPQDILDLLSGRLGNEILAQEKAGQQEVVSREILPREIRVYDDNRPAIELYAAMGIEVMGEEDDLFFRVKLPEGWRKEGTSHSMHSKVLDAQGRERLSIFYKAAFYDRKASASPATRYQCRQLWSDEKNAYDPVRIVTDAGTEIHRFAYEPKDKWDNGSDLAKAYMNEHYPDYQDPFAYWD